MVASASPPSTASPSLSRRTAVAWGALAFLGVLLLGFPSLVYPFGKDHGEYAYIAAAWLRGNVVYRDIFNVKPPLTHILHAASQLLFGPSMQAIRLFDWLWQTATAVTLFALARTWFPRRPFAAWLAAILYAVTYFATDFWHSAQTDGFINLPIALSVWLAWRGLARPGAALWLSSGLALGLAVLLKYPIGALLPALIALLFFTQRAKTHAADTNWPAHFSRRHAAFWLVAGTGLPLALFIIISAQNGSLLPFLEIQLGYIPQYNAGFIPAEGYFAFTRRMLAGFWAGDLRFRLFVWVWLAGGLATAVAAVARRPRTAMTGLFLFLWGAAALLHLIIQNKYYYYHSLPLLAPQALMVAYLVAQLLNSARARPMRLALAAAAALLPLLLVTGAFDTGQQLYAHQAWRERAGLALADLRGQRDLAGYQGQDIFGAYGWGVFSSRANLEAAAYLRENSAPDDTIFIWAFEPAIYYLAGRDSASRFIYNFPLYGRFAWDAFREEVVGELAASPPRYILVARDDAQPHVTGTDQDSRAALEEFPALKSFIDTHYTHEHDIAQFLIYRRIAP